MLRLNYIRENTERVRNGLLKRNWKEEQLIILDDLIKLDDTRKVTQHELDDLLAQVNKLSKQVGELYKSGERDKADMIKQEVTGIKSRSQALQETMNEIKSEIEEKLLEVPNVPNNLVPAGKSEEDNEVFRAWSGSFPDLGENKKPHWDLAKQYNIIDFDLGVKITGSGFPVFRGKGAKLQRSLIAFFLDEASKAGYEEILPPLMVNEQSARATGQLPDKEGQMYHVVAENFYLIPTAEVPITNIYREAILEEKDFPICMTGYTPCFRREAGSYGKDVRGLNRVHQFDKIEIVRLEHPDHSYEALDKMLSHVSGLLDKLELPYRILRLCGADLTFASALTYDFEVFSAGQEKWLEVSSVSNFETFQSNRMKLRYKDANGKTQLAHTLNGSALALARIVAAILENYQKEDRIDIPKVLVPYTGFEYI